MVWWFSIFVRGVADTTENYAFSLAYSVMPLGWGVVAFVNSRSWGGFKSSMGRALFFLGAGIFAWGVGNLIFGYYNLVLQVPVPYPSFADVGFILLYPLSAIGVLYLFRAIGVTSRIRKISGKVGLLIIPIFFIFISYYLLVMVARAGVITSNSDLLKGFLDVAYPVGDVVIIVLATIAYALSFQLLGGIFKIPIIVILSSFVSFYLADFLFSYTTTVGTYYVGKWVDLFYPTAFLLIGIGLTMLSPNIISRSSKND